MKCLSAALAVALATVGLASIAQADPSEYGIEAVSASLSTPQAGAHPDFTSTMRLKKDPKSGELPSTTGSLAFELPPGLLANPTALPRCTAAQLISTDVEDPSNETGCPQASQVGISEVVVEGGLAFFEPVYNLVPRYGEPARFGIMVTNFPVFVDVSYAPTGTTAPRPPRRASARWRSWSPRRRPSGGCRPTKATTPSGSPRMRRSTTAACRKRRAANAPPA